VKIALDYDETYTADPGLWDLFVKEAQRRGHLVQFVSFRFDFSYNRDIEAAASALSVPVIYTNARQKQHIVQADVWIDDSPESVVSERSMRAMLHGCERNGDLSPEESATT
jgi:hypothetical protein